MDDDAASRRPILGLGGPASRCRPGPGGAAVSGGAAIGIGGALAVAVALLAVGAVVRWRTGCSDD